MFNWAAVITRDIALRKLAGSSVEMVVVSPQVMNFLLQAFHDGVLYCVARDPDVQWTIDGVPLIEDRRAQAYEIK